MFLIRTADSSLLIIVSTTVCVYDHPQLSTMPLFPSQILPINVLSSHTHITPRNVPLQILQSLRSINLPSIHLALVTTLTLGAKPFYVSGLVTAVAVFRNPNTIPFCLTTDLLLPNVLFSWLLVHLPSTFFLDILFVFFRLCRI